MWCDVSYFCAQVLLTKTFCLVFFLRIIQTGCLGCASGKDAGPRNIFGNKYGQNLAAVQIAREKRAQAKLEQEEKERRRRRQEEAEKAAEAGDDDDDETDQGDAETDDDEEDSDDEDYGPSPAAGIWAGSQKLEKESERIADPDDAGEEETDDEAEPPSKKVRAD